MDSVYVYAIVDKPGESQEAAGLVGVDGANPTRLLACGDIGCVVSSLAGGDLRARPREEVLRCLLRHQQVVERVMPGHSVLPVRFGTTLASEEEAAALLAQTHGELSTALESVRGKVEVEVAATWDVARVLQAVSREDAVVRAREAIAAAGSPTLNDRMRLGQVVKACMDRRRDAYRGRMLALLEPLSSGVAPNALISDEMVINVAFLVDEARQSQFDQGVRELDAAFQDEVTFRVIGPLPPYSFSAVQVHRLSREDIDEARSTLGVSGKPSESEVRKAYRHLAAEAQRDVASSSSERLARLRRAAEVLASRSSAGGGGESQVLFSVTIEGSTHRDVEAARFGAALRL
ncbi:MAG: GvpL/GvpF family gas vesicle protein [Chloroflexi bacterium]|nr:GvpL/GvpF family gas vesicle protein [Chloroflexota bacterium]